MDLKKKILEILKSNETRRINFSFTGDDGTQITINYTSFQRVAGAIEGGSISLGTSSTPNADGEYLGGSNSLTISSTFLRDYGNSRLFNALIVHEAVHASFDLSRSRILAIDGEVAGYIAQGFYLRNSGYTRSIRDPLMRLGRECVGIHGEMITGKVTDLHSEIENDGRYNGLLFVNPNLADRFQASNRAYFQGNG